MAEPSVFKVTMLPIGAKPTGADLAISIASTILPTSSATGFVDPASYARVGPLSAPAVAPAAVSAKVTAPPASLGEPLFLPSSSRVSPAIPTILRAPTTSPIPKGIFLGETSLGGHVPSELVGVSLGTLMPGFFPVLKRRDGPLPPIYIDDKSDAEKRAAAWKAGSYPDQKFLKKKPIHPEATMTVGVKGSEVTIDFEKGDSIKGTIKGAPVFSTPDLLVYLIEVKDPVKAGPRTDGGTCLDVKEEDQRYWACGLFIVVSTPNASDARFLQLTRTTIEEDMSSLGAEKRVYGVPSEAGIEGAYGVDATNEAQGDGTFKLTEKPVAGHLPWEYTATLKLSESIPAPAPGTADNAVGMIDVPGPWDCKCRQNGDESTKSYGTFVTMKSRFMTFIYDKGLLPASPLVAVLQWGFDYTAHYKVGKPPYVDFTSSDLDASPKDLGAFYLSGADAAKAKSIGDSYSAARALFPGLPKSFENPFA